MNIKIIIIFFLYNIAITLSRYPLFKMNDYLLSTPYSIKNKKISNAILILKVKKIVKYIIFFKQLIREKYEIR
jgi:hypothetical protein